MLGRLQAAGLSEEAVQHFKQAWKIDGSKQNNKYSWSFRGPNSVREQTISGVVRWYKAEWQGVFPVLRDCVRHQLLLDRHACETLF